MQLVLKDTDHGERRKGSGMSQESLMRKCILKTRMKSSDEKAFEINPELFNTATPFNLGAAGIVLIVGMLYYFFWM